jgi:transposase
VSQMVFSLPRRVKQSVRKLRRETRDKGLAMRCQIVLLAGKQRTRGSIAESVGCSVSWVQRVLRRFREFGLAGLEDGREDNGQCKIDERYLSILYDVVDGTPGDYGYPRSTWTQELLARVMAKLTGVKVHRSTMSRALATIGARLGRPRPTVGCPWSRPAKQRRLREIRRTLDTLAPGELAFYVDEVDIHLNPKIGPDWMNRGKQKMVVTPGKNVKRYLAGAMEAGSGRITWVKSEKKNSLLFIALLNELVKRHPQARRIHVVLDNFKIHDSHASRAAVKQLEAKVVLHFLPPYCPNDNRIERVWLDVHANVTRNHCCQTMQELIDEVIRYLRNRNRRTEATLRKAA